MRSLNIRSLQFCCLVTLLSACLTSCSESSDQTETASKSPHSDQAQLSHCEQITKLFAMNDWESFASEPFKTNERNGGTEITASAKSLLGGAHKCTISRQTHDMKLLFIFSQRLEHSFYMCNFALSDSIFDDPLPAAEALAAPWRSCFIEWQESSGPSSGPVPGASISFEKENAEFLQSVTFRATVGSFISNRIVLSKSKIPRAVLP